uniref:Uncharacterized protein n=1 Tax=Oryza brachyantha TaxID=4533 RepID=J3M1Q5_ORYBR
MLWYHMPRNRLLLEAAGEKKPSAKTPLWETSTSPGRSCFACVSLSSDLQDGMRSKQRRKGRQTIFISVCSSVFACLVNHEDIARLAITLTCIYYY